MPSLMKFSYKLFVHIRSLVIVIALFGFTDNARASVDHFSLDEVIRGPAPLTAEEAKRIESGEAIFRSTERNLLGGLGIIFVNAQPERVFSVFTDYSHYAEFMPQAREAKIHETDEIATRLSAIYKSTWPFADVTIEAVNVHDRTNPARLRMAWKTISTNMKSSRGWWIAEPYKDGTIVYHENLFDLNWIPISLARSQGRQRILDTLVAVKKRSETLR